MASTNQCESSPVPAISDGWQRMLALTGLGVPSTRTGWDRLVTAIFETPLAQVRTDRRIEAIYLLYRALCRLSDSEFTVLVLRNGLTVDDRDCPEVSRREVSQRLNLSHSRIAQIERAGLAALREHFSDSPTRYRAYFSIPIPTEPIEYGDVTLRRTLVT